MSLHQRPPQSSAPDLVRSETGADGARLEQVLRSLPRAQASPGFTGRLMTRVEAAGAPRSQPLGPPRTWLAVAAAAALVVWLAPRAAERLRGTAGAGDALVAGTAVGPALDDEQVRRLLARRDELQQELRDLRRQAADLPPVVGVEGPSADYLVDLGELAGGGRTGGASAVPASYRIRP